MAAFPYLPVLDNENSFLDLAGNLQVQNHDIQCGLDQCLGHSTQVKGMPYSTIRYVLPYIRTLIGQNENGGPRFSQWYTRPIEFEENNASVKH